MNKKLFIKDIKEALEDNINYSNILETRFTFNRKECSYLLHYLNKLDNIKQIMETWNYYLPEVAVEELKEILNEI